MNPFLLFHVSRLSLLYCLASSLQPRDNLLGTSGPLEFLVCDISLYFVTFPYGVSDQVWYLIVSNPDLRLRFYFSYISVKK